MRRGGDATPARAPVTPPCRPVRPPAFHHPGDVLVLMAPRAVVNLSPFGHLPKLPGGEMAWGPVRVLVGLAAVLVAVGLVGVRRRDLTA